MLLSRAPLFAVAALVAVSSASGQTLLTSSSGATVVTDFSAACAVGVNGHFCFGTGPRDVGKNGFVVSYSASSGQSVIGDGAIWLGDNGIWDGVYYAGTNRAADWVRFNFPTAVWSVGGIINYAPNEGPPIIRAFDASNGLIASYDLSLVAPISTANQNDGAFRGIQSTSANIASFELFGAYLVTQNLQIVQGTTVTPEPSSLALCGAGLVGLLGACRRRRRRRQAR